ncbi:SGNH/GDSL hydrolase family protein [Patescibacteria group bacterium]
MSSFAYPVYQANSDLVITGPYDTATSGTANWGKTSTTGTRDFISIGQKYRIRQNGTISRVKLYVASVTNTDGLYVMVWRKDGSTYDLVGISNNIVNDVTGSTINTVDLSSPISGVQEGDFYGYRLVISTTGMPVQLFARTSQTGVTTYYADEESSATDYNWTSKLSMAGAVVPIEMHMQAPQVVFIGDSIMQGATAHTSYLMTTDESAPETTIEYQLSALTGYTYQNMGIGSQTTANISVRFTADVLNLKPKIVVIEGGVNDIAGSVAKSVFIANWTSMLDAAQADSSITSIIVLKILPWTNGTTVQMQTRDDWNASLSTLASSYSKAIVVDANSYVGQFRAGGDEGNLWDIQTAHNADGVHFNQAGHTQIAQAIADNLPKPSATFDNDFSSWNGGNITVNYNLIQTGESTNSNISQTGTSGIEYSTDGSVWSDATDAGGASEGLT